MATKNALLATSAQGKQRLHEGARPTASGGLAAVEDEVKKGIIPAIVLAVLLNR